MGVRTCLIHRLGVQKRKDVLQLSCNQLWLVVSHAVKSIESDPPHILRWRQPICISTTPRSQKRKEFFHKPLAFLRVLRQLCAQRCTRHTHQVRVLYMGEELLHQRAQEAVNGVGLVRDGELDRSHYCAADVGLHKYKRTTQTIHNTLSRTMGRSGGG